MGIAFAKTLTIIILHSACNKNETSNGRDNEPLDAPSQNLAKGLLGTDQKMCSLFQFHFRGFLLWKGWR